jgi:hypothetical protein
MFLEAYAVTRNPQPLVPAPPTREWMDAFTGRHPYRCLPLAIANTYGWQILLPVDVTAEWSGGMGEADIVVTCEHQHQAVSNFTRGVLTFDIAYVFRTPPGYHLLVTGPANEFKDGIAPMTAVIESDWLPYTFTFNYHFTRPGKAHWKAGEAYAQICVVQAGLQQGFQPVIRSLSDSPRLAADFEEWRARRSSLLDRQAEGDPLAIKQVWDKDYFLGRYADGRQTQTPHTIRERLKEPIDERR